MELGVGMFGDLNINSKGEVQPVQQRLQELIEEIKLMDEVGLDFFGIGEHHRPDYAVSTPEIILAAAATVTKNIKLGSAVSVLSSSDPVRLYQSFATMDLISNGRAELMSAAEVLPNPFHCLVTTSRITMSCSRRNWNFCSKSIKNKG